jgi:putative membrane protein
VTVARLAVASEAEHNRAMPPTQPETLRLHQANERTMLAWLRTGIALMAFGFAIARFSLFLRELASAGRLPAEGMPSLGSGWLGAALVAAGMIANLTATVRYGQSRRAIERGDVGAPDGGSVYLVGGVATLIGAVMTVLLVRAVGR